MLDALDFEQRLTELENEIALLRAGEDSPQTRDRIARREEEFARERHKVYSSLTAC